MTAPAYAAFLERKAQLGTFDGFSPTFLPDCLFDFQAALVEWAVRKGRAALFADCGLGKSPMLLAWAENVVRHTNGRVLVATPLAVTAQLAREAEKFGIAAHRTKDGALPAGAKILITNYEQLPHYDPSRRWISPRPRPRTSSTPRAGVATKVPHDARNHAVAARYA